VPTSRLPPPPAIDNARRNFSISAKSETFLRRKAFLEKARRALTQR
jgi:hypothetical protein